MIISYHPMLPADLNLLCAGRLPNQNDLQTIRRATAVILPQGCTEPLYRMAKANCQHVFPNCDIRFDYPGKSGQIRLFRELNLDHPETVIFPTVTAYHQQAIPFAMPWVLKLNWGGQGDGVWLADTPQAMTEALIRLEKWEKSGQAGFLIQKLIDAGRRSLRVTVIGNHIVSYWRVLSATQPFGTGVAHGAGIDHEAAPELRQAAVSVVQHICKETHLQMAGFDFLFSETELDRRKVSPLILEINYFFGRAGLGGSEAFYKILSDAVDTWLASIGLERQNDTSH